MPTPRTGHGERAKLPSLRSRATSQVRMVLRQAERQTPVYAVCRQRERLPCRLERLSCSFDAPEHVPEKLFVPNPPTRRTPAPAIDRGKAFRKRNATTHRRSSQPGNGHGERVKLPSLRSRARSQVRMGLRQALRQTPTPAVRRQRERLPCRFEPLSCSFGAPENVPEQMV